MGGMYLVEGTRGVCEARREDLRGSGGAAFMPSGGVRMLQSWIEILGDEHTERGDDAVSDVASYGSRSVLSVGDAERLSVLDSMLPLDVSLEYRSMVLEEPSLEFFASEPEG